MSSPDCVTAGSPAVRAIPKSLILDLEVNDDGRRRAFLRTFDIFDGPGANKQTLSPAHAYIDPTDGTFRLYDAHYRYPAHFEHGSKDILYKGEPSKGA